MYKCVFKEKRGNDFIFAMQLSEDDGQGGKPGDEVAEVVVSKADFGRANLNTIADRNGFLRSTRVKWQKGYAAETLFEGLEDVDSLPPGAQALADLWQLPEADALIFYQVTKLSSAGKFFDGVRSTADNSELGIS